jgi:fumarylpyruvate hydrolase
MSYVIPLPAPPSVAIAGSGDRFPVRRIFCVGRNYADHVREMGADPKSEPPIFFCKPADAVVADGASIAYAMNTAHLHYEVELVIAIGRGGANIRLEDALAHVWGYGVGVDLTRRDRQAEAKQCGAPWDVAKAFDHSAPISALKSAAACDPARARIWLSVNGEMRQDANTGSMIWSIPEIIAALSQSWRLAPGDLIFSGTPSGIGPLLPGDAVACAVEGVGELRFDISPRETGM